jgi:hypothetical protein
MALLMRREPGFFKREPGVTILRIYHGYQRIAPGAEASRPTR